jgi:hypothetical protein
MIGILILSSIFIIYEIFKLAFMPQQMSVLGDVERMSHTKNATEKRMLTKQVSRSTLHVGTLVFEFLYLIFLVVLLFTQAWFVGLLILALMFSKNLFDKLGFSRKAVWVFDSLSSVILLSVTYLIYL